MHIDKHRREDGYYDEDDCYYESAEDFVQSSMLGFCNCGNPAISLKLIRDLLSHTAKRFTPEYEGKASTWREEGEALCGGDAHFYFFHYWADSKGFTEHGGAVPGWLTGKGQHLLEDLNEMYPPETGSN